MSKRAQSSTTIPVSRRRNGKVHTFFLLSFHPIIFIPTGFYIFEDTNVIQKSIHSENVLASDFIRFQDIQKDVSMFIHSEF